MVYRVPPHGTVGRLNRHYKQECRYSKNNFLLTLAWFVSILRIVYKQNWVSVCRAKLLAHVEGSPGSQILQKASVLFVIPLKLLKDVVDEEEIQAKLYEFEKGIKIILKQCGSSLRNFKKRFDSWLNQDILLNRRRISEKRGRLLEDK